MNCISAMGRIPVTAVPTAAPAMAFSEMGVSRTRSCPNSSIEPLRHAECTAVNADVLADQVDTIDRLSAPARIASRSASE